MGRRFACLGLPFSSVLSPLLRRGERKKQPRARIPQAATILGDGKAKLPRRKAASLNRSRRRESALTFENFRWSRLTSAATRFRARFPYPLRLCSSAAWR